MQARLKHELGKLESGESKWLYELQLKLWLDAQADGKIKKTEHLYLYTEPCTSDDMHPI